MPSSSQPPLRPPLPTSQTANQPQATPSRPQRDRRPVVTPKMVSPVPDDHWRLSLNQAPNPKTAPRPTKNKSTVIELADIEDTYSSQVVNPPPAKKVKRKRQNDNPTEGPVSPLSTLIFTHLLWPLIKLFVWRTTIQRCSLFRLGQGEYPSL